MTNAAYSGREGTAAHAGEYPPLVRDALAVIDSQHALLGGVAELADVLGVTECHLIRLFTRCIGISPGEHLTRTRLDAAALLLIEGKHSVGAIAGLVGYASANYFAKAFKRRTGLSPSQYRDAHAGSELTPDKRRRIAQLEARFGV